MNKEQSNENMEIILNEFGEDIKAMQQNVSDMKTEINALQQTVSGFQELVKKQNITVKADTEPIQEILKSGMQKMLLITSRWPKVDIKRRQILLFPEQDAKLFYKIVFGRWFLMVIIAFAIGVCYQLGRQWIENKKIIEYATLKQNEKISKAWETLYLQSDKKVKAQMDTLFNQ